MTVLIVINLAWLQPTVILVSPPAMVQDKDSPLPEVAFYLTQPGAVYPTDIEDSLSYTSDGPVEVGG
jgi:hypothetical protein